MVTASYKQLAYKYQAMDWVLVLLLFIATLIMNTVGMPHCRGFEWSDSSISYPMKSDAFPTYSLALMAILVPVFYLLFSRFCIDPLRRVLGEPLSFLSPLADGGNVEATVVASGGNSSPSRDTGAAAGGGSGSVSAGVRSRLRPLPLLESVKIRALKCGTGPIYPWIKAHFWAIALELFVVDFMKLYAGRLRPDFLDRMSQAGFTAETTKGHDPHTDAEFFCELMKDRRQLREGRLSFPSGHSGMAFVIFTITTFYFLAHLRPFARQGSLARLLLALSPLLVPIFCAVSRTRDNKHNFSDIMAGSFIGIVAALLVIAVVFRQAGGPLTVYLARTDRDIEYVKQLMIANSGSRASPTTVGYNTVNGGGGTEMRALSAPSAAVEGGAVVDDGVTVAIPIGGSPTMATAAGGSYHSSASGTASSNGNHHGARVVVVTTVGERELNEDPAAVPWL